MTKLFKCKYKVTLSLCAVMLSSCSLSTWFLGTDNAPQPVELSNKTESNALNLVWSTSIGGGVEKHFARLNIAQNADAIYAMDIDGSVYALSLTNGRKLWSADLEELRQGVAYGEGKVFVSAQKGDLIALNALDGKILWRKPVAGSAASKATIANTTVVVRTLNGALQAFNAETGANKWNYIISKPSFSLSGGAAPVVFNEEVLVPTDLGQLGIIKLSDGTVIWGQSLETDKNTTTVGKLLDIDAEPVVYSNMLYIGQYNGIFAAIDLETKKIIWRKPLSVYSGLTVNEKAVYTTTVDSEIFALDRLSGNEIWRKKDLYGRKLTRPVLINGNLIFGDYDGYVHIVDTQSGSLIGSRKIAGSAFLPDIQKQGQSIILQDVAGTVYRVDVR